MEKLIKKHYSEFQDWDKKMIDHINLNYNLQEFSQSESLKIFQETNDILWKISELFLKFGKFKDEWDSSKCRMVFLGQTLLIKSLKTNQTFDFGVCKDEFYLQYYFGYTENLKYMKDEFWERILNLKNYGDFKFVENSGISSKEEQYFGNKTSNLFRIIRNYMLYQADSMKTENIELFPDQDLGWLEIRWKFGIKWEELIENSCKAFKDLYKINYELWKITDLKNKKYARQHLV